MRQYRKLFRGLVAHGNPVQEREVPSETDRLFSTALASAASRKDNFRVPRDSGVKPWVTVVAAAGVLGFNSSFRRHGNSVAQMPAIGQVHEAENR